MEEVPHRTSLVPLSFPCSVLCLVRVETEGLLDYQGRAGIISIVRWNLRPVKSVPTGVVIAFCIHSQREREQTEDGAGEHLSYRVFAWFQQSGLEWPRLAELAEGG